MVDIYSIQELFKCLNPLSMIPYTRYINRYDTVTLQKLNALVTPLENCNTTRNENIQVTAYTTKNNTKTL